MLAVSLPVTIPAQTPGPRVRRQQEPPQDPPPESSMEEAPVEEPLQDAQPSSEPEPIQDPAPAEEESSRPRQVTPDSRTEAVPETVPEAAPETTTEPASTTPDLTPATAPDAQTPIAPIAPRRAAGGAADGGLARRVRLGLTFAETANGMAVRAIAPRSAAESAGLREGDVVTMINAAPVQDADALLNRLRFIHPGEPVRLAIRRGEDSVDVQLVPDEALREGDLEAKVEYSAFPATRGRLRSIWSFPAKGISAPRPTVLIIRGVGASAADAPGNNPFRDLAFQLARAGVVVVRYDPQGVGDSEGLPNQTVDFDTEVADAKAALAHLREDPRVDPERIVLLGQGTGGGVAAVVASTEKVAGLAVIGMIARPLMEYLLESRRQQMLLAAVPPDEIDDVIREHINVYAGLLSDTHGPKADPYGIVAADGTLMGKTSDYWRQYDKINFAKLFSTLRVPVLNGIGEFDFVSTLSDHRAIAEALKANGQEGQALVIFDRADHDLRSFESREAAFTAFGSMDAPVNDRALATIVEWVSTHVRTADENR